MLITEIMLLFGGVVLTLVIPAVRGSHGGTARVIRPMQEVRRYQVYRLPARPRTVFGRLRRVIRTLQPGSRTQGY